jgi:hypothetical protein
MEFDLYLKSTMHACDKGELVGAQKPTDFTLENPCANIIAGPGIGWLPITASPYRSPRAPARP